MVPKSPKQQKTKPIDEYEEYLSWRTKERLSCRTREQLSWRTKEHFSCRTGEHVSWRTGEYLSSRTSENLCWKNVEHLSMLLIISIYSNSELQDSTICGALFLGEKIMKRPLLSYITSLNRIGVTILVTVTTHESI